MRRLDNQTLQAGSPANLPAENGSRTEKAIEELQKVAKTLRNKWDRETLQAAAAILEDREVEN